MPELEGRRSEGNSAVESAGGSFFSSAGGSPKPEAGRPEPECRTSERSSAVESAGGSFFVHRQGVARSRKAGAGKKGVRGDFGARVGRRRFFHRQGVAQIEAGKLKAQIEAPALGLAIHDAPKRGAKSRH